MTLTAGNRTETPVRTCHPVILCGGSGLELWPMAREAYPKLLMAPAAERTLLQETLHRVTDPNRFAAPLLVCEAEHRFLIADQALALGITPAAILVGPQGCGGSATAAAAAALLLAAQDPEALLLLLPSDHYVAAPERFRDAVDRALSVAAQGAFVVFAGASDGRADRNSGMFMFGARRYLAELQRLEPETVAAAQNAVDCAIRDLNFLHLDTKAFAAAPTRPIDCAAMERTCGGAVVPLDGAGWTDAGSWTALWTAAAKDCDGNALVGDVLAEGVTNSYIRGESRLVAAVGVDNLVLVETADAVLAVGRDRVQELRPLIDRLARAGRGEHREHRRVYRPWGSYESVDAGERHQVKRIIVKPGGRLSLQKHAHRAEHWVVVRGTARVTRGTEVFDLQENESTYIPVGTVHRLENLTDEPLHIIEVQSGGYLGEDDIVRLDDSYGRE